MARNLVQFQKGLSEAEFHDLYGSEERCQEAVFAWRWPQGFVCPDCGGRDHCVVKTRALYQCASCRRQTSLTAGTIFAASKLPLRTWFRAMYHLTQGKGGISSLELARRLGVTQTTAWKLKHKLMQVRMERDAGKRLTGRVEMDDAPTSAASGRAASAAAARPARHRSSPRSRPRRRASPSA
jgi:transposase-like protein